MARRCAGRKARKDRRNRAHRGEHDREQARAVVTVLCVNLADLQQGKRETKWEHFLYIKTRTLVTPPRYCEFVKMLELGKVPWQVSRLSLSIQTASCEMPLAPRPP